STLTGAAKAAGLDGMLNGATPHTLFAPNNAAFGKVSQQSIGALMNDKAKLGDLMNYGVVPGKVSYGDLAGMTSIKAVDGRTLPVTRNADGTISVAGAKVLGQGIDSSNGVIYPVDSVMMPPGFVMPQAAQAPAQGIPWAWLLLGVIVLAALGYLLTRPRRHAEPTPRARYEERTPAGRVKPGFEEERVRTETARAPEETMSRVRESVSTIKEPQIADIAKNLNLPLTGVALAGLNALISKGTFGDKQDFTGFLAKTFLANNLGSAMAGGKEPSENLIMDIIDKTGIAKGFTGDDTKKMLVPLLITGFMAIYHYLQKKPAVKTA
ncbi:MAG TPA: fasciclin domain-containing protein, partial [Methanocella sp.]|nr:fasciclin domain-containing protein [Methanocella sp.]